MSFETSPSSLCDSPCSSMLAYNLLVCDSWLELTVLAVVAAILSMVGVFTGNEDGHDINSTHKLI